MLPVVDATVVVVPGSTVVVVALPGVVVDVRGGRVSPVVEVSEIVVVVSALEEPHAAAVSATANMRIPQRHERPSSIPVILEVVVALFDQSLENIDVSLDGVVEQEVAFHQLPG